MTEAIESIGSVGSASPYAGMRVLTVRQPYASLIIIGAKPREWRRESFLNSRAYRNGPKVGERVVIHAGARRPKLQSILDLIDRVEDGQADLLPEVALSLLSITRPAEYPIGAGLGTAVIGEPKTALDWTATGLPSIGDSERTNHEKWGWPLTDIEPWEPVRPARGGQGFWSWRAED